MVLCEDYQEGRCLNGLSCSKEHVHLRDLVKCDIQEVINSNVWALSCYGPFINKPSIPNFIEDQSFEEVRWRCVQSKQLNLFEEFKQKYTTDTLEAKKKLRSLLQMNSVLAGVVMGIYFIDFERCMGAGTTTTANAEAFTSRGFDQTKSTNTGFKFNTDGGGGAVGSVAFNFKEAAEKTTKSTNSPFIFGKMPDVGDTHTVPQSTNGGGFFNKATALPLTQPVKKTKNIENLKKSDQRRLTFAQRKSSNVVNVQKRIETGKSPKATDFMNLFKSPNVQSSSSEFANIGQQKVAVPAAVAKKTENLFNTFNKPLTLIAKESPVPSASPVPFTFMAYNNKELEKSSLTSVDKELSLAKAIESTVEANTAKQKDVALENSTGKIKESIVFDSIFKNPINSSQTTSGTSIGQPLLQPKNQESNASTSFTLFEKTKTDTAAPLTGVANVRGFFDSIFNNPMKSSQIENSVEQPKNSIFNNPMKSGQIETSVDQPKNQESNVSTDIINEQGLKFPDVKTAKDTTTTSLVGSAFDNIFNKSLSSTSLSGANDIFSLPKSANLAQNTVEKPKIPSVEKVFNEMSLKLAELKTTTDTATAAVTQPSISMPETNDSFNLPKSAIEMQFVFNAQKTAESTIPSVAKVNQDVDNKPPALTLWQPKPKDNDVTSLLRTELGAGLADIKQSYQTVLEEIKSQKSVNKREPEIESNLFMLKDKIAELETANNRLQRRLNRADIIITGLPSDMTDMYETVMALIKYYGQPANEQVVHQCCYIQQKKAVLVKFHSIRVRDEIMRQYLSTRSLKLCDLLASAIDSRLYLNDHLTPAAKRLQCVCRQFLRESKIKRFYMLNRDVPKCKIIQLDDSVFVGNLQECLDLFYS